MRYLGQMKTCYSSELPADSSVGIGFECIDRDVIRPEKCYNPLAACGAKYARCQTGWAKCEKEKGVYQFGWLDDIVDSLLERGVFPWFNVGYGNPAYMPNTPNPTGVGCMPLLYDEFVQEGWKNYVLALARHFKGRITHWEIWNEPDIIHFWYPGEPDAAALADLVRVTGGLIRSVIPDAKIGVCTAGSKPEYVSVLFENLMPSSGTASTPAYLIWRRKTGWIIWSSGWAKAAMRPGIRCVTAATRAVTEPEASTVRRCGSCAGSCWTIRSD